MPLSKVPTEVIALIARHLELRDLLRLSAVSTTFRKGCYDRRAVHDAVARGRGGKLTRSELQQLLKINRTAAAELSHQYYPQIVYCPRGYYLYDATVVASAMHTFGGNTRVVSWKLPHHRLQPPRHRRKLHPGATGKSLPSLRPHGTPYADWSSFPNAASSVSSPQGSSPSRPSPSGCAIPVM